MNLYKEAIIYFAGGEELVVQQVDVLREGRFVGKTKLMLLNPEVALEVTSLKRNTDSYKVHLLRKLASTTLRAMHWINFAGPRVTLTTLTQY